MKGEKGGTGRWAFFSSLHIPVDGRAASPHNQAGRVEAPEGR